MRRFNFLLFDEYVGTSDVFTSDAFAEALGRCDQLAAQIIIEEATGTGFFGLWLQHSGDGRVYADKTQLLNNLTYLSGQVTPFAAPDASQSPGLAFARYRISLTAAAHVKVYVTCRDASPDTIT